MRIDLLENFAVRLAQVKPDEYFHNRWDYGDAYYLIKWYGHMGLSTSKALGGMPVFVSKVSGGTTKGLYALAAFFGITTEQSTKIFGWHLEQGETKTPMKVAAEILDLTEEYKNRNGNPTVDALVEVHEFQADVQATA